MKEKINQLSRTDRLRWEFFMQEITGEASVFAKMNQGVDFFESLDNQDQLRNSVQPLKQVLQSESASFEQVQKKLWDLQFKDLA